MTKSEGKYFDLWLFQLEIRNGIVNELLQSKKDYLKIKNKSKAIELAVVNILAKNKNVINLDQKSHQDFMIAVLGAPLGKLEADYVGRMGRHYDEKEDYSGFF